MDKCACCGAVIPKPLPGNAAHFIGNKQVCDECWDDPPAETIEIALENRRELAALRELRDLILLSDWLFEEKPIGGLARKQIVEAARKAVRE